MKAYTQSRPQRGITLLELLIVVAVTGILAAIAMPNYSQYVQRSRRAEAQAVMMEVQQFMQRVYAAQNSYLPNGQAPDLPDSLEQSPANGQAAYNIALNAVTATAYEIEAVPTGSMANDPCGTLTLSSTGRKQVSGSTVANCWR